MQWQNTSIGTAHREPCGWVRSCFVFLFPAGQVRTTELVCPDAGVWTMKNSSLSESVSVIWNSEACRACQVRLHDESVASAERRGSCFYRVRSDQHTVFVSTQNRRPQEKTLQNPDLAGSSCFLRTVSL